MIKYNTGKIGILAITAPGAAICYEELVSYYGKKYGKYHHPEIFLHHINFYEFNIHLQNQNWDKLCELMLVSAQELAKHNLDFIIIPANTVHIVIDKLKNYSPVKILSILDVVAEACVSNCYKTVMVLGTKWTMSTKLYQNVFDKHDINLVIPSEKNQDTLQDMILNYLVPQINIDVAQKVLTELINDISPNCDAIALACTELPMVLRQKDFDMPLIDTTRTLAQRAADYIYEITSCSVHK